MLDKMYENYIRGITYTVRGHTIQIDGIYQTDHRMEIETVFERFAHQGIV